MKHFNLEYLLHKIYTSVSKKDRHWSFSFLPDEFQWAHRNAVLLKWETICFFYTDFYSIQCVKVYDTAEWTEEWTFECLNVHCMPNTDCRHYCSTYDKFHCVQCLMRIEISTFYHNNNEIWREKVGKKSEIPYQSASYQLQLCPPYFVHAERK